MHLYVKIDSECYDSSYSSEPYGPWEESHSNHLGRVTLEKGDCWAEEVAIDYEAKAGDIVYVVWAEYSSGNSFGHSYKGYTDIVHVFQDKDKAWDCYRALMQDNEEWTVTYKTDGGTEIPFHRSWLGYFDSLDEIHVDEVLVERE